MAHFVESIGRIPPTWHSTESAGWVNLWPFRRPKLVAQPLAYLLLLISLLVFRCSSSAGGDCSLFLSLKRTSCDGHKSTN